MKKYKVNVNGSLYEIVIEAVEADDIKTQPAKQVATPAKQAQAPSNAKGENVTSPMPGTILSVNVTNGQTVKKGQVLMILEAMKMENEIMSPSDGKIVSLNIVKGSTVEAGTLLCVIG